MLAQLMPDVSKYRPDVKYWLIFAAIGLFSVLLARPQFGSKQETVKRKGVEVIIALDISKHQKIRLEYKERFLEESLDLTDRDLLESIYFREILQGIYLKLESIPERRRTVFELSRFYGKSHKEIADKMNISVRTVEQQIYLTLIELRKVLGAFAG